MTTRRTLTVAALSLIGAAALTDSAEARGFGHRGRTYVYNGSTGYYTNRGNHGYNHVVRPVYGNDYGYQGVYRQAYVTPTPVYVVKAPRAYAAPR
jgi:hypothetical protein